MPILKATRSSRPGRFVARNMRPNSRSNASSRGRSSASKAPRSTAAPPATKVSTPSTATSPSPIRPSAEQATHPPAQAPHLPHSPAQAPRLPHSPAQAPRLPHPPAQATTETRSQTPEQKEYAASIRDVKNIDTVLGAVARMPLQPNEKNRLTALARECHDALKHMARALSQNDRGEFKKAAEHMAKSRVEFKTSAKKMLKTRRRSRSRH